MKLLNFFKKLRERGFTLIELIATIALLAIIALISFVSINAVINNNKEKQYKNLLNSIKVAAKQYASENKHSDTFSDKSEVTIHLSDLSDYISMPIIDPYTNQAISNTDEIEIILYMDNGSVKDVVINGMPEHGNVTNESEPDVPGEIVDNNGNSVTPNNYRQLTLSCLSDERVEENSPSVNYNNCWLKNGNNTETMDVLVSNTVDVANNICSCYEGVVQVGWVNLDSMEMVEFGSFTMPDKDVTLYALYDSGSY